jgi:hypothetical protein
MPVDQPAMTRSIYCKWMALDAKRERLVEGCPLNYGVEDFCYATREFAIRASSGYLLQFGQRLIDAF